MGMFRRALDGWQTRGGPAMVTPGAALLGLNVDSDARKPVVLSLRASVARGEFGVWTHDAGVTLELKPSSSIRLSLGAQITRSRDAAQYVQTDPDPNATATFGSRYVFSNLDQTQVSMSTRATWVIRTSTSSR